MRFGASIWPFQWAPPYDEAIRRLAAAGFAATELIAWDDDFLTTYYTPETIRNLVSLMADEGVLHSQFVATPPGLSSPDAGQRAWAIEYWRRAVDTGAALGAPLVNMVAAHGFNFADGREYPRLKTKPLSQKFASDVPSGLDWERNYADYVEAVRDCAEVARAAGVRMTIEPHPARYVANTDGALRLLEHVDHSALTINFDPSHTFPVGDFPDVSIQRLGRHIAHCHASDNDGVTNAHWRPGLGKIDWHAMFAAFRDVGYDGVVSIELEDVPGRSPGRVQFPDGYFRNIPAEAVFVDESVAGMQYLKSVCADLGIGVH